MEVGATRVFAKRVWCEQAAAIRASPVLPGAPPHTRDHRLSMEIALALRADQRLRRERPAAPLEHLPPVGGHYGARRFGSTTAARLPPLLGSQVATPVSLAGSMTSHKLQERLVLFKNMETGTW